MQIGAISYQPYIYNTNAVSSKSLNKISAIGKDALESKTDVSALLDKDNASNETLNPLKRGQSLDFAGILGMQMQMSRMNAARIMKNPVEENANQALSQNNPAEQQSIATAQESGFDATV